MDETPEFEWPNAAHSLRAISGDSDRLAFIDWQQSHGILGRLMGYRRAAEILAERVVADKDNRDLDTVIFPFAALWRHYMELQLKSLVLDCRFLLNKPYEQRRHHEVLKLWQELQAMLAERGHSITTDEVKSVNAVMFQLHGLDPASEDFRYANRRDGTETMRDVKALDYVHFNKAMTAAANFLEAVDTELDIAIQAKLEYEAERQSEYEEVMQDLAGYW